MPAAMPIRDPGSSCRSSILVKRRGPALALLLLAAASFLAGTPAAQAALWGDQGDGTFRNPFLWADYNNLDVIRQGSDFYMISASHHFMGMPVLHSRDMVNWTLIARVSMQLDLHDRYDRPGQAYQHGTWAPAIRYHEGLFRIYVCTPEEGLILSTASNPAGPWSAWQVIRPVPKWEDPCPFWDDVAGAGGDGPGGRRAYLVRSRFGAGPIIIHEMSWDGKTVVGEGRTVATGPTLEGPKLHKRGGYYYIFAPEGGIDQGYQVVLRSRNIWGPYEKRTILQQGSTATNGPHQGSWIDLESGESWFYHFQQNKGWGRIGHLQPARWGADGWPAIGVDADGNGIGEPVARPRKPNVGGTFPIRVPQASDDFAAATLGLQWLWNHNPDPARWSLAARPGWLRLTARPLSAQDGVSGVGGAVPFREDNVQFAYNTLVQLAMGRESQAATRMEAGGMAAGQRAGLVLFGQVYGWIGVIKEAAGSRIAANVNGTYFQGPPLTGSAVHLRAAMNANSEMAFAYSLDGAAFTALGRNQGVTRIWFEGIKFGFFTYLLSTGTAGGYADFDDFRYSHDGPKGPPTGLGETGKAHARDAGSPRSLRTLLRGFQADGRRAAENRIPPSP